MLRILVTGATGFIGKAVSLRLKEMGHMVIAQGRDPVKCAELRQLGFHVMQVSDKFITKKACLNQDVVINCSGLGKIFAKSAEYHSANVNLPNTLISGCLEYNAKFIHISSPAVYVNFKNRLNISEKDKLPTHAASDYAQSKLDADRLILDAQKKVFAKDFTLDLSEAKAVLKYRPKISTNEGLKKFSVWYKQNNIGKLQINHIPLEEKHLKY